MRLGYHNASFHYDTDDDPFDATVAFAQRIENAGFDWFSVMDHLWQLPFVGERTEPFFDCYTTLPAIAQATESVEISALVTSVHYRNPAMLGRILATLDHVSDGRAVLGIGAGWFEEEYEAYDYDFPDPPERISQLADAIELVRTMWTDAPATYHGEHYDIEDLILQPKPVQDPHPPIMVGGGGEQLTLRVAARHADRWNVPGASPADFEHKLGVLEEHCKDVGRDVAEIEPSVLATAVIRDSTEAAHEAYERLKAQTDAGLMSDREDYRGLVGTPAEAIERLEDFESRGAEMVMARAERNDPETVDSLLDEVAPAVR